MYVINAATGRTGRIAVNTLLSRGKKVRVLGRDPKKLDIFTSRGAEALTGDMADADFLNSAYAGASAVYILIPTLPQATDLISYIKKIDENHLEAIRLNGVKHVVLLSSIGAHLRHGAGVVDGLGYLEEIFSSLKNVNVLNLRPGYFMENFLGQIGIIKQMGITGSSLKADLRIPVVATSDIGAVVGQRLGDLNFSGHTVEYVLGQRDLSMNEITAIIGKTIGKPDLKYVEFSFDDFKKGLVQSGFASDNVAGLYYEMNMSFNNGKALGDHKRTPENSSPTTFEKFAGEVFLPAYNNS